MPIGVQPSAARSLDTTRLFIGALFRGLALRITYW